MARTINKVELLGRVGTDPEMQYTPNGTAVTKLRLATDRRPPGRGGRGRLAQRRHLEQDRRSRQRVHRQGRPHLRRRTPGEQHLGRATTGSGATAPRFTPPRSSSSTLATATGTAGRSTTAKPRTSRRRSPPLPSSPLSPQPHSDASLKAHHGVAPHLQGRPRSCF